MPSWTSSLHDLYQLASRRYAEGERDCNRYFEAEQTRFLAAIGIRPMELYDFAEDQAKYGEPDWETVLLIQAARRDYFLHVQQGKWSDHRIDLDQLPPKTAALEGIEWLPRLIPKAWAKLKGEMPDDLMYGCGGDRRFIRDHHVDLADFLRVVWAAGADEKKIVAYVRAQRPAD